MARYQYRYRLPQRRRIPLVRIVLLLALAALAAWPFLQALTLEKQEHVCRAADLPDSFKNLRIVYASDFHQGTWFSQERLNDAVYTINSLSPDLIILGGDYASDMESAIAFFRSLPSLRARLGVFGVLGEHDRTQPGQDVSELMKEMTAAGVIPLVNTAAHVKVGQHYLTVAGVDDLISGTPDVEGLASQVREEDFVILAGHNPDLLTDMLNARSAEGASHWYDLALFGHTHGGQVNLLGHSLFDGLTPAVGPRYLSGWLEENRACLLVSNGVGTTGMPVRLFAPPQIHLITLQPR